MEENNILIECGSRTINTEFIKYIEEYIDDFKLHCKQRGVKIRDFDVNRETNVIYID